MSTHGRFIEADPIGIEQGDNHLYVYGQNDPVIFVDPLGLIDPIRYVKNLFNSARSSFVVSANLHSKVTEENIKALVAANNLSGQSNELMICLAYKESGFDRYAVPRDPDTGEVLSSARGLTQVTKGAAKDTGYDHNLLFFDPATSIKAGSKYLRLRIKWADGDVTEGLNGYGTGSGYATGILLCEKCLKNRPCNSKDCLKLTRTQ